MSRSRIGLRIEAGRDRDGRPEGFDAIEFSSGQVVALVGPTGSGKTRLLADIERLSLGDSPTGRRVSLTGAAATPGKDRDRVAPPTPDHRVAPPTRHWAVARISQTMQFFLDLTVREFIEMHAQARADKGAVAIEEVYRWTNALAGEPVTPDQPLAALSGGQARALMVADLVLVSRSPILLIDEIENAGIDRHAALRFLIRKERLVFVATHDPLIALRSHARLVLAGGGVRQVLATTPGERVLARRLAARDREVARLREAIRIGKVLGGSSRKESA